jgi:hypothetical protein
MVKEGVNSFAWVRRIGTSDVKGFEEGFHCQCEDRHLFGLRSLGPRADSSSTKKSFGFDYQLPKIP